MLYRRKSMLGRLGVWIENPVLHQKIALGIVESLG